MVSVKASKPIDKIVKGDKININGNSFEVDAQYVMIDHGKSKEMAIDIFDPKAKEDEGDAQLRYFSDRIEDSISFYVLKAIVYEEQEIKKIEW